MTTKHTTTDESAIHDELRASGADPAAWSGAEWHAAVRAGLACLQSSDCRLGPAGCPGCLDLAVHAARMALGLAD